LQLASWRLLAKLIKQADVVVEVVDIRDPISTRSRRLEKIVDAFDKRLLIILNKADLVPRLVAEKWKRVIEGHGYEVLYVSATKRLGTKILRGTIKRLAERKPFVATVVGYPKTGKSSIINALRARKGASTSPVPGNPGYTKSHQLYKVEPGFYLIDTPGTIPVEGSWPEAIIRGRAPEELKDPVPPAAALIEKILKYNAKAFEEAYGITSKDSYTILEELAKSRGWFYKKSKEPLIEEAARTIIRDYHKAKIKFFVPPEEFLKKVNY